MINKVKNKLTNLPKSAGIYQFYDINGRIIYIGKASVLKNRVKSYFIGIHDSKTEKMIPEIADIKWQKTASTIEAIILESNLIKKYKPKYNIREKDDKSFVQIALTNEEFPRLILYRPTDKNRINYKIKKLYGPYTEGASIKEIISIFRKIFTFRDCTEFKFTRHKKKGIPCLFHPIKLCPAPCVGKISKSDYVKIIKQITDFLDGKKKRVIYSLKKQMLEFSKKQDYEKAAKIRNRIYAFEHINDLAVIKNKRPLEQYKNIPARIEAYDISNLGKDYAVASMVVFSHGEIDKPEYRKFKVQISKFKSQNDPGMIGQILDRRLYHLEWNKPDLIIIDGGKGQLSAALKTLKHHKQKIPVIAIAKGSSRKGYTLFKNSLSKKINLDRRFLESIRDEAHRFAIGYHRKLRSKSVKSL